METTRHRCTVCPVFSLCLGALETFIHEPFLQRCQYCKKLYIVPGKEFDIAKTCAELASLVAVYFPYHAAGYDSWCGGPCQKKTPESYVPKPLRRKHHKQRS